MILNWEVTASDVELLYARASQDLRGELRGVLGLRALLIGFTLAGALAVATAIALFVKYRGAVASDIAWLAVWVVVSFAALLAYSRVYATRARQIRRTGLGPFPIAERLEVTQAGLRFASRNGETFFPWSIVRSLSVLPEHFALAFSTAATALVPFKAFVAEDQRREFEAEVRSHVGS